MIDENDENSRMWFDQQLKEAGGDLSLVRYLSREMPWNYAFAVMGVGYNFEGPPRPELFVQMLRSGKRMPEWAQIELANMIDSQSQIPTNLKFVLKKTDAAEKYWAKVNKRTKIALAVARRIQAGQTLESASFEAGEEFKISDRYARGIWSDAIHMHPATYGKRAGSNGTTFGACPPRNKKVKAFVP